MTGAAGVQAGDEDDSHDSGRGLPDDVGVGILELKKRLNMVRHRNVSPPPSPRHPSLCAPGAPQS